MATNTATGSGDLTQASVQPPTSEGRLEAEVDVLLAVETNDEAGHIDHLGKRVKKLAQVDEVNT